MHSASARLGDLARMTGRHRPQFDLVIAFDFYDGPENGLALYDSGHAVRFASLGGLPLPHVSGLCARSSRR
jgi:hypothetical protein